MSCYYSRFQKRCDNNAQKRRVALNDGLPAWSGSVLGQVTFKMLSVVLFQCRLVELAHGLIETFRAELDSTQG